MGVSEFGGHTVRGSSQSQSQIKIETRRNLVVGLNPRNSKVLYRAIPVVQMSTVFIPAVRLNCIACFSPIAQSIISTDFNEILQGLFASHSATTGKFSSENIVQQKS